tara:strand:+ start:4289 stop:4600 length:312 start_codon:yes stop_codon:yes gene_type:complete
MVDRKRELKKWLIDHPEINSVVLGRAYGCTKQAAHKYLLVAETAPAGFVDVCRSAGIPDDLLPSPTRSKAAIQAENRKLQQELCFCWDALAQSYIQPGALKSA